ncbi:membrane bound O-acyl transferase family-domain-containing protein [Phycomyces nitens]|nr:membrane bound O-acyl transferase family-domain-containing protein [Phycomyces nitens]
MFAEEVWLYGTCFAPLLIFYLVTKNNIVKLSPTSTAYNVLLSTITAVYFITPLLHNGNGGLLGLSAIGLMACCFSARMMFYIIDLNRLSVGDKITPFWDSITPTELTEKSNKVVSVPIQKVRSDAVYWILMATLSFIMLIPVMVPPDTFIKVCAVPPEAFSPKSYAHVLLDFLTLQGSIPLRSIYYHMALGFTIHLHVAILLPLYRIFRSEQLLAYSFLYPNDQTNLVESHYYAYKRLLALPPIFDKPWMSRSSHELWSKRWHQVFRPGFQRIGYLPLRRLFGKYRRAGQMAGVMGAFTVSGLMHEYVLMTIRGYSRWNQPGVNGYQALFFLLQGISVIVTSPNFPLGPKRLPAWAGRLLTIGWIALTGPLFTEPYVRIDFQTTMTVPVFPDLDSSYLAPFCPYGLGAAAAT